MALEEMFSVTLDAGALFYGETRHRLDVALDEALRALTTQVARDTRAMLAIGATPAPVFQKRKCGSCSLAELCRPQALARPRSAAAWLSRQLAGA